MAIEAVGAGAGVGIGSIGGEGNRAIGGKATGSDDGATGFADSLGKLLDSTNATDGVANTAVGRMLDGSGDVHDAMIALQQADMMLQLTVQVRNKLVSAYQDIMRMPV